MADDPVTAIVAQLSAAISRGDLTESARLFDLLDAPTPDQAQPDMTTPATDGDA